MPPSDSPNYASEVHAGCIGAFLALAFTAIVTLRTPPGRCQRDTGSQGPHAQRNAEPRAVGTGGDAASERLMRQERWSVCVMPPHSVLAER